jgi:hypothetical protein
LASQQVCAGTLGDYDDQRFGQTSRQRKEKAGIVLPPEGPGVQKDGDVGQPLFF